MLRDLLAKALSFRLLVLAAALVVAGICADLPAGWRRAHEAIDTGAAREVLERWKAFVP